MFIWIFLPLANQSIDSLPSNQTQNCGKIVFEFLSFIFENKAYNSLKFTLMKVSISNHFVLWLGLLIACSAKHVPQNMFHKTCSAKHVLQNMFHKWCLSQLIPECLLFESEESSNWFGFCNELCWSTSISSFFLYPIHCKFAVHGCGTWMLKEKIQTFQFHLCSNASLGS